MNKKRSFYAAGQKNRSHISTVINIINVRYCLSEFNIAWRIWSFPACILRTYYEFLIIEYKWVVVIQFSTLLPVNVPFRMCVFLNLLHLFPSSPQNCYQKGFVMLVEETSSFLNLSVDPQKRINKKEIESSTVKINTYPNSVRGFKMSISSRNFLDTKVSHSN